MKDLILALLKLNIFILNLTHHNVHIQLDIFLQTIEPFKLLGYSEVIKIRIEVEINEFFQL